MAQVIGTRDFDEGFELFCTTCEFPVARYFLSGPKEGTETAHVCRCEMKDHAETVMPEVVRASSLRSEHKSSPLLDMFDKSAVVRADWLDLLSVVKLWWYRRNAFGRKFILLTSDARLRDVGSGDYAKKQRSDDYSGPVYNTIDDFVVPPDLIIVQLGVIRTGTKDGVYFQGKLTEALYTRFCAMKPMWVVIRPGTSFSKTYYPHVWSEESEEIVRNFPTVDAVPAAPTVHRAPLEADPVEPSEPGPRKKKRSVPEDPSGVGMYGSGIEKPKGMRGRG